MKHCKMILIGIVFVSMIMGTGCDLLESAVSDVDGWDLSACVSGIDTCWELYTDNTDKFSDSFAEDVEGL